MQVEAGDILLTHNTDEVGNDSPGFWNHAAIYVGEGKVIEAQADPVDAVICVTMDSFWERYPEIKVIRCMNALIAHTAAAHAYQLKGHSYRKIASLFRFLRHASMGENCVSVVRKAYRNSTGIDPGWFKPDDIFAEVKGSNFTVAYHKQDYENWVKPENWYEYAE
jgi:uncharacterized protein YycO